MNATHSVPLLVGEVGIDVTITPRGEEQKLRLGGIAHAARGFWASNTPFAAAAVLPNYLEAGARRYLASLGCVEFVTLGEVMGECGWQAIDWRAFPAFVGIPEFLRVDELTPGSEDCRDVVSDSPVELELLQITRHRIQYVRRNL